MSKLVRNVHTVLSDDTMKIIAENNCFKSKNEFINEAIRFFYEHKICSDNLMQEDLIVTISNDINDCIRMIEHEYDCEMLKSKLLEIRNLITELYVCGENK